MGMSEPYKAVLSLGCECETTLQIERFFKDGRPNSPFDWLVTPIDAVIEVLEDAGNRFGTSVIAWGGGSSALCAEYGVLYHHEFPRRDGMVIFSTANIDRCRSKMLHKFESFREVARHNRTLFVRGGIATDLSNDSLKSGVVAAEKLNLLVLRLEELSKRPDFTVVVVLKQGVYENGRTFNERIENRELLDSRIVPINCQVTHDWPAGGDPTFFANMFRAFGLTPDSSLATNDVVDQQSRGEVPMNLVIGYCANYSFDVVEPFIASFIRNVPNCELCLFASGMDERFYREAQRLGIRIEDPLPYTIDNMQVMNARFFMYKDFISANRNRFSNILLSDIRDVLFQSDPFAIERTKPLMFAAEDGIIRTNSWNSNWLLELYGQSEFEEIADNIISCAGTTIGSTESILEYVTIMCDSLKNGNFDKRINYDQGIHNYIVWKLKPAFGYIDLDDRIVSTVIMTHRSRVRIEDEVVLIDDIATPIIHQWDRQPAIVELVSESKKFRIEV